VERRVKHPPLQEGQGWGTRKGEGRCLGEGVARDSEGIREKACYRGGKDYYDARNKCPEDTKRGRFERLDYSAAVGNCLRLASLLCAGYVTGLLGESVRFEIRGA
jgi:hypothetical protein